MRTDAASLQHLAAKLAALTRSEVSQLQLAISNRLSASPSASDACFAVAPVILEKTIITSNKVPGDIAARVSAAAVREYETLLQKSRDPAELLVQAISLNKSGFLAQYKKNKAALERAWNFARDQEADPFASMGIIAFTYCRHVANEVPDAPEATAAMQSALEALVSKVHETIEEA